MGTESKISQIGLDVHRRFSLATARDASQRIVWREKLRHENRQAMRKQLSRWPKGTPVILEGTFGWGWMSDELRAQGLDAHLSSSRKVAGWREARGIAKSNKIDGDLLSELWSEKTRWWEVWLAPQEVRDRRELLRHRMSLVQMQTMTKNRIHSLLHRHGIINEHSDLFGSKGRRMLSLLVHDEDRLRATSRGVLKEQLILLDALRRLIAHATRQFRSENRSCASARRLMTLPGISTVLAYTIAAEIGRIERFRSARHLLRYSLLAPLADDSGEEREGKPIGRRIGHAGRQTLQWAWIEAARGAARKDARFGAIFNRLSNNGKDNLNRSYIAVANHLCRIAYSMWKNNRDYQEVPPQRPGQKKEEAMKGTNSDSSRPGMGQPSRPLATCRSSGNRRARKASL